MNLASSATFSPCRAYRYSLWRHWADLPYCVFIGLNPSTADETQDDPTIRRCIDYSKQWGYGALFMLNLFAFRATDPKDMMLAENPVGVDNDYTIKELCKNAGIVVAAWGKHGNFIGRNKEVEKLIPNLHCLKQNKDGTPAHPLYLKKDLKPYLLQSV